MAHKKVYLVRHGQTDFNLQNIVQGSGINSDLNATGLAQAEKFYQAYQHIPFDHIYISALKRTRQSVQKFIEAGIPTEEHAALNEINWGNYEGTQITVSEDLYYRNMLETWQTGNTDKAIEGGESPEAVAARQRPFLDLLRGELQKPGTDNILICMHGRAMRIILCQFLNYPLKCMDIFPHQNLGFYELRFNGSFYRLEGFLNTAHLD